MPAATSILRQEHDAILRMLDATEEAARMLDRGEQVAPETLRELLEFFRVFADRCHHGKEEDLLFPLLERKGLPRTGGPIGVMLVEHEQGRALIRQMGEAGEAYARGVAEAAPQWATAARGYTALLRQHIDKENNVLFQVADSLLSEAEQGELVAAFEKVETDKIGAGTHERLHALMDRVTRQIHRS